MIQLLEFTKHWVDINIQGFAEEQNITSKIVWKEHSRDLTYLKIKYLESRKSYRNITSIQTFLFLGLWQFTTNIGILELKFQSSNLFNRLHNVTWCFQNAPLEDVPEGFGQNRLEPRLWRFLKLKKAFWDSMLVCKMLKLYR